MGHSDSRESTSAGESADLLTSAPNVSYARQTQSAASATHSQDSVNIGGIPVDNLSERETVALIDQLILDGGQHFGAVVNAAKIVAAQRDPKLKKTLIEAQPVTADGMSVVWASRILGQGLKERVTGIDLFERLIEHSAERKFSVYFLGADDESVRGVVELLATRHPRLKVAGYHHGYFEPVESKSICAQIASTGADLLFVAMGSPKQEHWIAANLTETGVKFALGVGGSFDHLSGRVRRAPRWMQESGLEWLHRLALEPARLWRRYLIGNSAFIWLVVRQFVTGSRPR